jgi:hypothetical protein
MKTGLPLFKRVAAWRRGFVSSTLLMYRQDGEYLSDYARHVKTPDINERFKSVLDNKMIFSRVFNGIIPVPQMYFWLDGGRMYSLEHGRPVAPAEILNRCHNVGRLIVKNIDGGGGANIFLLEAKGGHVVVNHTDNDAEQLLISRRNAIVIEFARQHSYAEEIFPYATNTIRILTMWDYEVGSPFIAATVHRFGRFATIPVDGWLRGGLSVDIDRKQGRLGKGIMHPSSGDTSWHAVHPDTGTQIEGTVVPGWERICREILHAASMAPFTPYIAWDVVATEKGYTVLEGNTFCDVHFIQIHRPLLNDPRVRKFYEQHGVL